VSSAAAVEQILSRQMRPHPVPVRISRGGRTHELMLDL
jgi:hypothetical protein